jgi:catechol 2,3-dioxygenase-like lactoylglutathione lyase family enzyme
MLVQSRLTPRGCEPRRLAHDLEAHATRPTAARSPIADYNLALKTRPPWPKLRAWTRISSRRRDARKGTQMTENGQNIDFDNLPVPSEGFLATLFITVRTVARSRAFYSEVLGGKVVLEENPCMVKLGNSWIIMNPGGPPTPDKPDISVVDYEPGDTTSIFLNLRVADIDACYREWSARGAKFVTPPIDRGAEIRCYMRDPDGYLIEVGQSTGLLSGHLAAKRPEDLPG